MDVLANEFNNFFKLFFHVYLSHLNFRLLTTWLTRYIPILVAIALACHLINEHECEIRFDQRLHCNSLLSDNRSQQSQDLLPVFSLSAPYGQSKHYLQVEDHLAWQYVSEAQSIYGAALAAK